jgi:hypothetical protein
MTPLALLASAPPVGPAVSYGATYGPYAFGVASLLLIWYVIVRPEMARSRVDLDKVKVITDAQSATAALLERLTERLERAAERLEHHTEARP